MINKLNYTAKHSWNYRNQVARYMFARNKNINKLFFYELITLLISKLYIYNPLMIWKRQFINILLIDFKKQ